MTRSGKATIDDVVKMLEYVRSRELEWSNYWKEQGDQERQRTCIHCWYEVDRILEAIQEGDEIKVYCDNGDYVVFYTNEKEEEEK